MTEFRKPEDNAWTLSYYDDGRLERDDDPAGGFQRLRRFSLRSGQQNRAYAVRRTTGAGRGADYQVWESTGKETRIQLRSNDDFEGRTEVGRSVTRANGFFEQSRIGAGRSSGHTGPDAQWGGFAEHPTEITVDRGPVLASVERSSEATLADPRDPLSLVERTDRMSINGREYTSHYDAATRRLTRTTPEGRTSVLEVDLLGRPVSAQLGDLEPVLFDYDSRGRLAFDQPGQRS